MKHKVAIVVPVYGTEKYITACIDSILAQTYTNFHLILIDDASPDNAGAICDEYAKKDKRITVVHQENSGATRARANGVALAQDCDYITFVDSDDTITPTALSNLVSAMTDESDIVISYRVANVPECQPIEEPHIKVEDYIRGMLYWRISPAPWGKLFRKRLFNEYIFDIPREITIGEDLLMNLRLAYNSTSKLISVMHEDVYNYNIYDGNTTKRFSSTPQFESSWHKLIVSSILDKDERINFIKFSLPHRLQKYINFGGQKLKNQALTKTDFYRELKEDIQRYNYKFPSTKIRRFFYTTNPLVRAIFIGYYKIKNKAKQIIRHPDYPLWRAAIGESRAYRDSPKRQNEGYYLSTQTATPQKKKIVCIYDSNVRIGGWADRLRGVLSVYQVCKEMNLDFRILFDYPFPLKRYLIPNKVEWEINRSDLSFNLASTDLCFVSSRTGRKYEMRKQERWFKKEFKKGFSEYHVRTNAAFSYKYDFSKLFNELFRISPLLESLIASQKKIIKGDYISVSFRFLDLLGDFNETASRGTLELEEERKKLINSCIKQLELLHEKHPQLKILVNSDSTTFLQTVDVLPYTYVIPGKVYHVDSPESVPNNTHDKTITDFFMIANAQDIYLVIADQMYDSGFPYAASQIYGRPFHKIHC